MYKRQVEDFPFLDAPDRRAVRDGVALLVEIGALAQDRETADAAPASSQYRLTGIGRDLARLPIDPRLGRMLLEAERLGCASEVLVIVAALSIPVSYTHLDVYKRQPLNSTQKR